MDGCDVEAERVLSCEFPFRIVLSSTIRTSSSSSSCTKSEAHLSCTDSSWGSDGTFFPSVNSGSGFTRDRGLKNLGFSMLSNFFASKGSEWSHGQVVSSKGCLRVPLDIRRMHARWRSIIEEDSLDSIFVDEWCCRNDFFGTILAHLLLSRKPFHFQDLLLEFPYTRVLEGCLLFGTP